MANDFFDKMINKSKEVASSVAKGTGELVDKGKAKASELQTKGDIKEEYRNLGEFCYGCAKSGTCDEDEKAAIIARIDALMEKLAALETELGDKKEEKSE